MSIPFHLEQSQAQITWKVKDVVGKCMYHNFHSKTTILLIIIRNFRKSQCKSNSLQVKWYLIYGLPHELQDDLILPAPRISEICIKIKNNLNFFFILLCGTSKGFMKALKAFIKPFAALERSAKIKIKLIFSLHAGKGPEGLWFRILWY